MHMEAIQKYVISMTKEEAESLRDELGGLEKTQLGPKMKELHNLCRTFLV